MTTVNFETEECCVCGICFQVPEEFAENRQADGLWFFCPNGHEQHYTETEEEEIAKLTARNLELQVEVRKLKCKLLGRAGLKERIKAWFKCNL